MPVNIFFWHKIIPPLHFHSFQTKQKNHMFNFSRRLISKTTAARCTFRTFFLGGWQAVSLVFKPPSLPQIFSVISDTSCHTPYLFFRNTSCVTPPQIIFANFRRYPQNFDFSKTLIYSNCKTKRYF